MPYHQHHTHINTHTHTHTPLTHLPTPTHTKATELHHPYELARAHDPVQGEGCEAGRECRRGPIRLPSAYGSRYTAVPGE